MRRPRDWLTRSWPVGAPGAASQAGVPQEQGTAAFSELAAVRLVIDDVQKECGPILTDARARAEACRTAGHAEAAALLAEARAQAQAEEADAASAVEAEAEVEIRRYEEAMAAEAQRIRARADVRRPEIVALVMATLYRRLEELTGVVIAAEIAPSPPAALR